MTKVKREKSFIVQWISYKCRENFLCMENVKESQCLTESLRKLSQFIEHLQKPQNFLRVQLSSLTVNTPVHVFISTVHTD